MFRLTPFIATVLLVLHATGEAVAAEGWRRPLDGGAVAKAFVYDRATPFAGGARRGIDVAAASGARVGAVCGGVVTWAGRVPRWGKGVTLRCPRGVVATELGLASVAVARGEQLAPGATLGRLSPRGVLRVGARRSGDRFGWIDPVPLFDAGGDATPLLVPPVPRRLSRPRVAPGPTTAAARHPARRVTRPQPSAVAPHIAPPPLPTALAVAGLGLLVSAAGTTSIVRARRRGWRIAEIAVLQR
ncbi:peptidoglycan DD-metalloendopeptidase family protein [Baekduia sp. Peel2402]|uniref:peptidoglycan DD-metalloendopeptidase family protein n=1 Tax=Baekduia sp. Peel2402 TaxID=3458296 RepID=UPI00403EDD75